MCPSPCLLSFSSLIPIIAPTSRPGPARAPPGPQRDVGPKAGPSGCGRGDQGRRRRPREGAREAAFGLRARPGLLATWHRAAWAAALGRARAPRAAPRLGGGRARPGLERTQRHTAGGESAHPQHRARQAVGCCAVCVDSEWPMGSACIALHYNCDCLPAVHNQHCDASGRCE